MGRFAEELIRMETANQAAPENQLVEDALTTASLPFGLGQVIPPQTARQLGQTLTLGLGRAGTGLLDVLAMPGRAAYTAVTGEEPTQPTYTERLESAVGAATGLPTEQTPTQALITGVTPLPGFGKLELAKDVGLNLLSYLGQQVGEKQGGTAGGLVGALAAPTAFLTAKGGTQKLLTKVGDLYNKAKESAKIVLGKEAAIERAAQREVLAQLTPEEKTLLAEMQKTEEVMTGTGGTMRSLAEIVPSAQVTQYQQAIGELPGAERLKQRLIDREQRVLSEVNKIGVPSEAGDIEAITQSAIQRADDTKDALSGGVIQKLGGKGPVEALAEDRGAAIQQSLVERADQMKAQADEAWEKVKANFPGATVQVGDDLKNTLTDLDRNFAPMVQNTFGEGFTDIKRRLAQVVTKPGDEYGRLSLQDYTALKQLINGYVSSTTNNVAQAAALQLRDGLDTAVSRYADEATQLGQAAGVQATEELKAIRQANAATRRYKETFADVTAKEGTGKQIVPKIVEKSRAGLVTKASDVMRLLKGAPENAEEIIRKFGKDASELTVLRQQLLADLDKAADPIKYLSEGKNLAVYRAAFQNDFPDIRRLAVLKAKPTGYESYAKLSPATISTTVFKSPEQTAKFLRDFEGTALPEIAKNKFVQMMLKGKGPTANLQSYEKVGSTLFGADWPTVKGSLQDLESARMPGRTETAAVGKGKPATASRLIKKETIKANRTIYRLLDKLSTKATVAGALVEGASGGVMGFLLGNVFEGKGRATEDMMNAAVGELLSNPSTIKLIQQPTTPENVVKLSQYLKQNLFPLAKASIKGGVETLRPGEEMATEPSPAPVPTPAPTPVSPTRFREALQQKQTASTGTKQDVASLIKSQSPIIQAIIQTESAGNPNAKSKKGAAGLMQLMESTAKGLGVTDRFDPVENVNAGTRYFNDQLDNFKNKSLALAAYNWGPTNVRKAISKVKAKGLHPTWQNILDNVYVPLETQKYVSKVLSLESKYRS